MKKIIKDGRKDDIRLLKSLPMEKIPEFIFMHLRDLWAVDGLYFLGIEEKWGTDAATEIDKNVWKAMGKIEARRIKKFLGNGNDIPSMMKALRLSSWALDIEDKEYEIGENEAIMRNTNCRVQNTRIKKGLGEFPCKQVRWEFLKAFAKEFNPEIKVECVVCPPDEHSKNLWCEWKFVKK
ncbi:MAG: hypothetical protein FE048_04410 [Thermoplasmata archaeon]|nr:MAG: hypothetical protein FE048_04410 [Thermoplasmata archaeon]